jgi:PAS domain S-box-containing protein
MDAPIGIFQTEIIPEEGRAIDVNPAFAKMLGYASPAELMDTINQSSIVDTIFAEPVEKRRKVIEEVLKTNGWYVYEQLYRRKNGSIMIARQRVRAIRDADGKPLFLEGLAEDITQERLAEQKAKQLQSKLLASKKREAIGILAGGIAHDFNNLLSPIIGFAELSVCELPEKSKLRSNIDQILTAAGRARDLARQILTFSHQENQERRPVLLQSLVQEAVQLLRHSLPATVEIRTHIDEFCNPVLADPSQIQQVIMNLGTNAFHAMKEDGGVLDIRMRAHERVSTPFTGFPDAGPGPYVEIAVADTGCGVDPKLIEKVFDPYFTTKAAGEGTGLGLSMVHGIVTNHGGAIAVESKSGEGTTFRIYIPSLATESEDVLESVEETISLGQRQRILLVDDEIQILEMLEDMMVFCNYDVVTAAGAEQALSTVRSSPESIDLVITDLTMPKMSGVQLAREIVGIRPEMPIILCTGFIDALDQTQVRDASIRKLLLKPVGMKALSTAIREVLEEVREEKGGGSPEDSA